MRLPAVPNVLLASCVIDAGACRAGNNDSHGMIGITSIDQGAWYMSKFYLVYAGTRQGHSLPSLRIMRRVSRGPFLSLPFYCPCPSGCDGIRITDTS